MMYYTRNHRNINFGLYQPLHVHNRTWEMIYMDFFRRITNDKEGS